MERRRRPGLLVETADGRQRPKTFAPLMNSGLFERITLGYLRRASVAPDAH
jgi:hypothetical protein